MSKKPKQNQEHKKSSQTHSDENSYWSLPKQLRFRVHDNEIRAEASTNLGEFVVGVEIIELLRLLNGTHEQRPTKLHSEWVHSFKEAAQAIPSPSEIPSLLADLQNAGVLKGQKNPSAEALNLEGFADAWIQWAMLADSKRLDAYQLALNESVKPGDSVLDLGSGTGVLSYFAARAGASHILAVEESACAIVAEKLLKSLFNQLRKSPFEWKVLRSNSSDALAQIKAFAPKILVSELFGHDPLSEGILPTLREVQNAIGPELVSIPESVSILGQFITLDPSLVIAQRISDWHAARTMAKQVFDDANSKADAIKLFQAQFCQKEDWSSLSFPYALREKDFTAHGKAIPLAKIPLSPVPAASTLTQDVSIKAQIPRLSSTTVFIVWFEARLSEQAHLSSHPLSSHRCSHWNPIIIPLWNPKDNRDSTAELRFNVDSTQRHFHLDILSAGQRLGSR